MHQKRKRDAATVFIHCKGTNTFTLCNTMDKTDMKKNRTVKQGTGMESVQGSHVTMHRSLQTLALQHNIL